MDAIGIVQAAAGILLLFASGYCISLAVLGRKADKIEAALFSAVFGITVPPLVLLLLNLGLKVPFNAATVYGAFIAVGAVAFAYAKRFGK